MTNSFGRLTFQRTSSVWQKLPPTSSSKPLARRKPALAVLILLALALLCYARLRHLFADTFARFRPVHLAPLNPPPSSQ